jgi:hypothetical protein
MKLNLITALCNRNGYSVQAAVVCIRGMCRAIDYGTSPTEIIIDSGLNPRLTPELQSYYDDYMDEQDLRMEDVYDGNV